jgi:hypothetical protein
MPARRASRYAAWVSGPGSTPSSSASSVRQRWYVRNASARSPATTCRWISRVYPVSRNGASSTASSASARAGPISPRSPRMLAATSSAASRLAASACRLASIHSPSSPGRKGRRAVRPPPGHWREHRRCLRRATRGSPSRLPSRRARRRFRLPRGGAGDSSLPSRVTPQHRPGRRWSEPCEAERSATRGPDANWVAGRPATAPRPVRPWGPVGGARPGRRKSAAPADRGRRRPPQPYRRPRPVGRRSGPHG